MTSRIRAAERRARARHWDAAGRPATVSNSARGVRAMTASRGPGRRPAAVAGTPTSRTPHTVRPVTRVMRPVPVPVVRAVAVAIPVSSASTPGEAGQFGLGGAERQ